MHVNVKVALILAVGMIASAAVISFAPIWTWQAGTDVRLERVEAAAAKADDRLQHLDTAVREQGDKSTKTALGVASILRDAIVAQSAPTNKHLERVDAAVRDIQKQLAPLNLERAAAPMPRPIVLPNSIAVLAVKSVSTTRRSEDTPERYHAIAGVLTSALVEQPRLRVMPLSASISIKKDDKDAVSSPQSPQVAGRALGAQYVVAITASFDSNTGKYPMSIEIIEVESGVVLWSAQKALPYASSYSSGDSEAAKLFKEVAEKIAEKVAEKTTPK